MDDASANGQLGSNADVADGRIRKGTRSDEIRPMIRPGHSLRYDLSAPPPASQVFATDESAGLHISMKPCAHVCAVGPPSTKNHDTNHRRDFDDTDLKFIQNQKTLSADLKNKPIRTV